MPANLDRILLDIALGLSANLTSHDQYQRLIKGLNQVMPCDASALLVFDNAGFLTPVASSGLQSTVMGRRFLPSDYPRLEAITSSKVPVRFDADCTLPDPFDGMLLATDQDIDVHDCMGCSLYVEQQLVGALTMDSLTVGAFDKVDHTVLETFAALAAASLRNRAMLKALRAKNVKQQHVTEMLIQQARKQQGEMIGSSNEMRKLRLGIDTVATSDYSVLISGETGSGKELVAHQIHAQSRRCDQPMVYVNCAALAENLAESELFGHVKGAFTGANQARVGKFELADGGSLFLDEIGELPLMLQAKLLRAIQHGEVQRVGSDRNVLVDVRIIAATNRDLVQEVADKRFRADLFHRLNVYPIHVPPLRERAADIAMLSGYLLDKVRHQFNVHGLHLDSKSLVMLEKQHWPGNVRELEHSLTRAALNAIQAQSQVIRLEHFYPQAVIASHSESDPLPAQPTALRELVTDYQARIISQALERHDGVWAKAAQFLKTDRGNLYRLGKKLGIDTSSNSR